MTRLGQCLVMLHFKRFTVVMLCFKRFRDICKQYNSVLCSVIMFAGC